MLLSSAEEGCLLTFQFRCKLDKTSLLSIRGKKRHNEGLTWGSKAGMAIEGISSSCCRRVQLVLVLKWFVV